MKQPHFFIGLVMTGIGAIFLAVGLIFWLSSPGAYQELERVASLPQLSAVQLADTRPGVEAVIEGRAAERNELHRQGFVAYISRQYQGERCETDDDGNRDCESIWQENERVTPALWLDVAGGRARLSNNNYAIENPPAAWQSTEGLRSYETVRLEGFKINDPVFAIGQVVASSDGPALQASLIFGGTRQDYLTYKRAQADSMYRGGLVFGGLGGLMVLIGGAFIIFKVLR